MRRLALLLVVALSVLGVARADAAAPTKLRWASMGDSYAAGEGLEHPSRDDLSVYGSGDRVAGSGNTTHDCQRALADDKYPSVAWGAAFAKGKADRYAFVACTGAITDDLFAAPRGRLQAGQLEQARFFAGTDTFDVVTFSFGGNNIGFADVVMGCAGISPTGGLTALATGVVGWANAPWVGCTVSEQELKTRIDGLTNTDTVDDHPKCNDLGDNAKTTGHWDADGMVDGRITLPEMYDVVGRCVAPGGTVVVMGYPQAVEEIARWGRVEGNRCHRIRRADVGKLRGVAAHLNYRIQQAVEWADANTPAHFVFVDPNNFWEGGSEDLNAPSDSEKNDPRNRHALCGPGEDWLNGVTVGGEGDGVGRYKRSFHPKQQGHDAMARAASHVDLEKKLTAKSLLNAPVPSVCGHPAGRLVNGELPGVREIDGYTTLDTDPSLVADVDGDGRVEAFAFISCTYGGVGTPDTLAVWGPGPALLDHVSLFDLVDKGKKLGEYESDRGGGIGIKIDKAGRIRTSWLTHRDGDLGCCASYPLDVFFKYAGGKLTVDGLQAFDEYGTVRDVIGALNAGSKERLRSITVTEPSVRAELEDAAEFGARPFSTALTCAGNTDSVSDDPVKKDIYRHAPPSKSPGVPTDFLRGCTFKDADGYDNYLYLAWDTDDPHTKWSWVLTGDYITSIYGD